MKYLSKCSSISKSIFFVALLALLLFSGCDPLSFLGIKKVGVPDVRGAIEKEAVGELEEAGLKVKDVKKQNSESVSSGKVIRTKPQAGTKVKKGSSITIVVSEGPARVAVPDVGGMSLDEALKVLKSLGFEAKLSQKYHKDIPEGIIIGSNPAAGNRITKGSIVEIFSSLGAEHVTCSRCGGTGVITTLVECPECGGTGICYS
ncbi:MAG: PASTA domain-containing protein [Actinomycetota bacterium]|nr:PASTA domain-containing protein [Actinomycetota bacterium]